MPYLPVIEDEKTKEVKKHTAIPTTKRTEARTKRSGPWRVIPLRTNKCPREEDKDSGKASPHTLSPRGGQTVTQGEDFRDYVKQKRGTSSLYQG